SLPALPAAAADAVRAHPGEQPRGDHPGGPVPDDEPGRLPPRARARGLGRLPGRQPAAQGPRGLLPQPRAPGPARLRGAGRLRARAADLPGHPAGHPDAAALRQHVRRAHPPAAVRPRRRVPAPRGRGPAQARLDPGVRDVLHLHGVRDPDLVPAGLRLHPAGLHLHRRGLRRGAL
ncbi:MAG: ATP synthase F0 sector subunit a, partial [uncultured Quadrisphaera sp.]